MAPGVAAITLPDIRWARRDIKTVNLLPTCWPGSGARSGRHRSLLVDDDGSVTEGAATNAWIVTRTATSSPARPTTPS